MGSGICRIELLSTLPGGQRNVYLAFTNRGVGIRAGAITRDSVTGRMR
jgi:hypothetical protein